jgi:hypothetical protein
MTDELDLETYIYISNRKFQIFLYDKKNFKNLYKNELNFEEEFDFINVKNLYSFLDNNIFKIEKLAEKFIKNVFLIIETNKNLLLDIGIKKKYYENSINQKNLENTLVEVKDLFIENYHEQIIMHMVINSYLINGKKYLTFPNDLNGDHLCLEINFTSISNELTLVLDKILEKYQIKISQYLNASYLKDFFKEENMELSEMACKIRSGHNNNEVILVPKNTENIGFFEKFFQLFS